jgi:hypothetical protein
MKLIEFDKLLEKRIKYYKLTEYRDEIYRISKKAILIYTKDEDKLNEVGNTRFFGQPDIYPELEKWLIKKEKKSFQPRFFCQINLKDIAEYQNLFPKEGILYFFDSGVKYYKGKISNLRKITSKEKKIWIDRLSTYEFSPESIPFKVEFNLLRTLPADFMHIGEPALSENYDYTKLVSSVNHIFHKKNYIGNIFGYYDSEDEIIEGTMSELNCIYDDMVTLLSLLSEVGEGEHSFCIKLSDLLKFKFNKAVCNGVQH